MRCSELLGQLWAQTYRPWAPSSDLTRPHRTSQLLGTLLQIGETARFPFRFESRWGRWILNDLADTIERWSSAPCSRRYRSPCGWPTTATASSAEPASVGAPAFVTANAIRAP